MALWSRGNGRQDNGASAGRNGSANGEIPPIMADVSD